MSAVRSRLCPLAHVIVENTFTGYHERHIMGDMAMFIEREFCDLMEAQMKILEMGRSDLARKMGRSPAFVTDYLNGRYKPGAELMEKFFEAVGLEVHLSVKPLRKNLVKSA